MGIQACTTGKYIHGGISLFGPGVNGEMTFDDDDHAGDALGTELMEMGGDHRGIGLQSGGLHELFDQDFVVQHRWVTVVEFNEHMAAQGGSGVRWYL